MDDFAATAHAKQAAIDWYEERARDFDHEALRLRWVGFIVQAALLRNTAKILRRAAVAEQVPAALQGDDGC